MSANMDVVVIGNIVKETILRPDKILGPFLGSPCAYTSLALAKMGRQVGMVTYCGEDFKKEVAHELRLVDTSGFIPYRYTTENHLIYQDEEHNRAEYFQAAPVIHFDVIPKEYQDAPVFFICPMDYEVSVEIGQILHAREKKVIVDLGGFGGTTSYNHFAIDTNRGRLLVDSLCKYSYMIKASHDDMRYIMPGMTPEECTAYLVERGPKCALLTMGGKGAVYREEGKDAVWVQGIVRPGEKNLTGAGDVYAAGVISAQMDHDIAYAMEYGNAAASLALEEKGGCVEKRMPTDVMIKMRMEGKL